MNFNNGKNLFIGIDIKGDLVNLELNFNDLNKGTKFYNPHFYLTFNGFTDIKDEETGKQEARERLEDSTYWEEIGFLENLKSSSILERHIDFKGVAKEVINNDGWEMTNGEYYFIGIFKDKNYYINLNWCGFDKEHNNLKDFKKLFISKEDFNFLIEHKETKEEDLKNVEEIKKIFSKYQDKNKIIKSFLEEKQI